MPHQHVRGADGGRLSLGRRAQDFSNLFAVILKYVGFATEQLLAAVTGAGYAERCGAATSHLTQIRRAGERALGLTGQLIAFREAVQAQILDLDEVITAVKEMLRRTMGEDDASVAGGSKSRQGRSVRLRASDIPRDWLPDLSGSLGSGFGRRRELAARQPTVTVVNSVVGRWIGRLVMAVVAVSRLARLVALSRLARVVAVFRLARVVASSRLARVVASSRLARVVASSRLARVVAVFR